jgi:FolB domain-containing protein
LTNYSELFIPGLRIWISLGCSPEERATQQPIDIDIKIKFINELPGCSSDQLADVVCYHTLTEQVIGAIQNQSFHVIEFLAARIFASVEKQLHSIDAIVEIAVTKPHHPVPHVQKGIVFTYCRRVSQKSL